jgi:creatinine amidohydrolase
VVGLDFVNRLSHPVNIATAAYWDIARPAILEKGLLSGGRIPGHAGRFETSLVMAIRPELVDPEGLARAQDVSNMAGGLFTDLVGGTVQTHGTWAAGPGYTDAPMAASAEEGRNLLEVIVERVAEFLVEFDQIAV